MAADACGDEDDFVEKVGAVALRALVVGGVTRPERAREALRAAKKDLDERVRQAAAQLLKRLDG
jgi:hypothetical protein